MNYACCFCGETIERADAAAVHLAVTSLWRASDSTQSLHAHSECAAKAVKAAPFDPEALAD